MVEDVEGEYRKEGGHLPSTSISRQRTSGKICEDKYWNCLMVIQARLCTYEYYRQLCCNSCQKV
uniref:PLAC domain-containing protein n=1 Tax=Arion vulgaris TaxID=1028688 RepID=A0A0B7AKS2_9EUPU